MNALPGFASVEILPGQVNEWLMRNDGTGDGADGARLLKKLFAEFSQTTYDDRKTQDSVELTKLVVKTAPARFAALVALLKPMLADAGTCPQHPRLRSRSGSKIMCYI